MRSRKPFSFDEQKDAENILLNGFPNGTIDYVDMYVIAKYFRETYGFGAIKLEREIVRFCTAQDKNFNPVVEAESIKKWISSAMNYRLRKIEKIDISQIEIDFLKTIQIPKDRKLLFVTLVLSKALKQRSTRREQAPLKVSDNYYIRYNNFQDIIKLSKIKNTGEIDLAAVFHKYKEHLTFYKAEKELIKLEFVDKHPEVFISIDNPSMVLEYYDMLFGKHKTLGKCADCGSPIIKNNNKQVRCKKCAKIKSNEQHKELMQKRRAVTK